MDKSRLEDVMLAVRDHGWFWQTVGSRKVLTPPVGDEKESLPVDFDEDGIPNFLPEYSKVIEDTSFIAIATETLTGMTVCVLEEGYSVRNIRDLDDAKSNPLVFVSNKDYTIDPNRPVRCTPVTITFEKKK